MRDEGTPGDFVKNAYDNASRGLLSRVWQGILRVSESGFGKGALAAAGVAVLGMAAGLAVLGATGHLATMTFMGPALATAESGFVMGLGSGLAFLGTGPGLLALAAGGLVGMAVHKWNHRHDLTPAQAQAQAQQYDAIRQQRQTQQLQAAPEMPVIDEGFLAREQARRAATGLNATQR
jgi:hypothetical protein